MNTVYDDDPRVMPTSRGVSFTFHDQLLFVRPNQAGAGWDIVDADGERHGYSDTLDGGVRLFLGEPQTAPTDQLTAAAS